MALGWHSEPGCIVHGVPGSEGVYKPYEQCVANSQGDFFTFGHGSTIGTVTNGVNSSYWVLTIIGIIVMIVALAAWVITEDRKLKAQADRLLVSGQAGQVRLAATTSQPSAGGPAA